MLFCAVWLESVESLVGWYRGGTGLGSPAGVSCPGLVSDLLFGRQWWFGGGGLILLRPGPVGIFFEKSS